jgi:phosphoserine phosphatase
MKNEILLLNVVGPDHVGLTAALCGALASRGAHVLDIGQSSIHDQVNLGMLLEIPRGGADDAMEELRAVAREHRVTLTSAAVAPADYEAWVAGQGRPRYIVTLLGRKLSASVVARVTAAVSRRGLNIDAISRLSGRFSLETDEPSRRACVEFSLRVGPGADAERLREELLSVTGEDEVDLAFQRDDLYRRNRRLIVFDMDSTLIRCEVMDELAERAGVGERVAAVTAAAMRGEIDFTESFTRRLALLKGLDEGVLKEIAASLPITEGADRLIGTLKRLGYRVGILSGGFHYFADALQARWGLDHVSANRLEIVDGKLTGRAVGEIVDGEAKARRLREMAAALGVGLQQTVAVGDGANDLPMLKIAGLGVAFHAKPVVQAGADHAISTLGLDGILYLLGLRDREIA